MSRREIQGVGYHPRTDAPEAGPRARALMVRGCMQRLCKYPTNPCTCHAAWPKTLPNHCTCHAARWNEGLGATATVAPSAVLGIDNGKAIPLPAQGGTEAVQLISEKGRQAGMVQESTQGMQRREPFRHMGRKGPTS